MLSVYLISDILNFVHQLIKVPFIFLLLQEKPCNTRTGDELLFTSVQQSKTSEKALTLDTTAQESSGLVALNAVVMKGDFWETLFICNTCSPLRSFSDLAEMQALGFIGVSINRTE